jgi:hypothetical protein
MRERDDLLICGNERNNDGDLTCCYFCGVEGLEAIEHKLPSGARSKGETVYICPVCASMVNTSHIAGVSSYSQTEIIRHMVRAVHIICCTMEK